MRDRSIARRHAGEIGTAVSGNGSIVTAPVSAEATKTARARLQYGCIARVAAMFWIYWDTLWSLFFSAVWFMTVVSHPDAEVMATWRGSDRP
jgi:hypothetical protein